MTVEEIKSQIKIRYSKSLYASHGRSDLYHFFYGYKRLLIEVVKSLYMIGRYIVNRVRSHDASSSGAIAIYATGNQKKSLDKAFKAELIKAPRIYWGEISFGTNLLRFLVWTFKFIFFPILFFIEVDKPSAYQASAARLLLLYNKVLLRKLRRKNIVDIAISNDHSGDVFILSLLLRESLNISVNYVQHGAVKYSFPENYFDKIYVYDEMYVDVYRKLSKNVNVEIVAFDYMSEELDASLLYNIDALICLSHQFHYKEIRNLIGVLRKKNKTKIAIRFHPSDRFSKLKFILLNYNRKLLLSSANVDYKADFSRADLVICASSSLLLDAYKSGFCDRLIWLKSIGLTWDYYDLQGKIRVIEQSDDLFGEAPAC